MTTKPRPGERVRDYHERCAAEMLRRAGATETEAEDFAEIVVIRLGFDVTRLTAGDAGTLLWNWRAEKRNLARAIREDRQRHLDAGYMGIPVTDPVYLNGRTAW